MGITFWTEFGKLGSGVYRCGEGSIHHSREWRLQIIWIETSLPKDHLKTSQLFVVTFGLLTYMFVLDKVVKTGTCPSGKNELGTTRLSGTTDCVVEGDPCKKQREWDTPEKEETWVVCVRTTTKEKKTKYNLERYVNIITTKTWYSRVPISNATS